MAGRKIFVGSLPQTITDGALRAEFNKYGVVEEVFVKQGCEPGRQWAFVTFSSHDQAQFAKEQCDRVLLFPGAERPCDVMVAKNQGMFGQQTNAADGPPLQQAAALAPRKIFVGSLPDGIDESSLRAEFGKYGYITDVFMKDGCDSGKQWCFITFTSPDEASFAAQSTNGLLVFPGAVRPCEVTLARNQGMFGQSPLNTAAPTGNYVPPATVESKAPRKIFVGSLPDDINEVTLRAEFSKYGQITDVFIKAGCEPGRQWAFLTFATAEQAQVAKSSCDCILQFPGSPRTCEVTLARHQGMFGQDPVDGPPAPTPIQGDGPKKIFVGSLPDDISEALLKAEFRRYGQVVDVFIKPNCEPSRQWAFVTFATHEQAVLAKESTDRVLNFPGSEKNCEVMLAKNQGKFGQEPLAGGKGAGKGAVAGIAGAGVVVAPPGAQGGAVAYPAAGVAVAAGQPPPPSTPPPMELTPWRMYQTAAGLPYYHNHVTGATQWECPPELQVPGRGPYGQPTANGSVKAPRPSRMPQAGRFSPY